MNNPELDKNGFDRFGGREPIPNEPSDELLNPNQQLQQSVSFPDVHVANNAVKLWGSGVRVKNGAGYFCAPPASQTPIKNSDYLRMFVDSSYTNGVQLGYGVLNLPMSSVLYVNDTGELPDGGHTIVRFVGPKAAGTNNQVSPKNIGITDFSSVVYLLTAGNSIESSGLFNTKGAIYYNTTLNKFRGYNGAWINIA